jgi:hypothetical protein
MREKFRLLLKSRAERARRGEAPLENDAADIVKPRKRAVDELGANSRAMSEAAKIRAEFDNEAQIGRREAEKEKNRRAGQSKVALGMSRAMQADGGRGGAGAGSDGPFGDLSGQMPKNLNSNFRANALEKGRALMDAQRAAAKQQAQPSRLGSSGGAAPATAVASRPSADDSTGPMEKLGMAPIPIAGTADSDARRINAGLKKL